MEALSRFYLVRALRTHVNAQSLLSIENKFVSLPARFIHYLHR